MPWVGLVIAVGQAWSSGCGAQPVATTEMLVFGTASDPSGGGPFQGNALPRRTGTVDVREDLEWRGERAALVARPRLLALTSEEGSEASLFLNEGYGWAALGDGGRVTAGRKVMAWGPSNFRSPSNPYHFDSGKNQPLIEVRGVDTVSVSYLYDRMTFSAMYVSDNRQDIPRTWSDQSWLVKTDFQANAASGALVASIDRHGNKATLGGYGMWQVSDALLMYGEAGYGYRQATLDAAAYGSRQDGLKVQARKAAVGLLGATYTAASGVSVSMEYLWDGYGYTRDGNEAYAEGVSWRTQGLRRGQFAGHEARIAGELQAAYTLAPALLGRHYAYAMVQGNPQRTELYWRAMMVHNFTDHSSQITGYGETWLSDRVALVCTGVVNIGAGTTEFPMLLRSSISLGVKVRVF